MTLSIRTIIRIFVPMSKKVVVREIKNIKEQPTQPLCIHLDKEIC